MFFAKFSRVVNVIVIDNFPIVHPDDLVQIVINHRELKTMPLSLILCDV